MKSDIEALIIRIYAQSNELVKIIESLRGQGLKVIVHSSSERGEGYEELIVYREVDVNRS